MPVILPPGLGAAARLRREGVEVLDQAPAHGTALRVGLLNLMPNKTATEVQFARLLAVTRRHVELMPALPASYRSPFEGAQLYASWSAGALPQGLDGLIVTGAPLEHVAFEDVIYWRELLQIFDWATCHVGSTLYVCWAAFAALNAFHGVPMRILPRKLSGVFEQRVTDATHSLTAGMGATFPCPVSRHAEVAIHDVPWRRGLLCLAQSTQSGLCLIADERRRALYMFNHLEYDGDTLNFEYQRDRARGADLALPRNYWPNDNMSIAPPLVWRASAERLFANWLATLAARASAQLPVGPTQSAA